MKKAGLLFFVHIDNSSMRNLQTENPIGIVANVDCFECRDIFSIVLRMVQFGPFCTVRKNGWHQKQWYVLHRKTGQFREMVFKIGQFV